MQVFFLYKLKIHQICATLYKETRDNMIRHIVMWNYKNGFTEDENKTNAKKVKHELESLTGCIKEIVELRVHINELSTSNMDVLLDSLFENEEALATYKFHPEHQRVAAFIETVLNNRVCMDYES